MVCLENSKSLTPAFSCSIPTTTVGEIKIIGRRLYGVVEGRLFEIAVAAQPQPWRDMQTRTVKFFGLALLVYLALGLIVHFTRPHYGRCDFYNRPDTLDGGVKLLNGTSYRFQMCGTGGNDQDGTDDKIELKVFNDQGTLLARRYFSVNWYAGRSFHPPLAYEDDFVRYIDVTENSRFEKRLNIPPTKWDWIRARLPLF